MLHLIVLTFQLNSQSVGPGRVVARFGVDGDLSTDTSLNGGAITGTMKPGDDWFWCPNVKDYQGGIGVIDTTGAYNIRTLLQSSSAIRADYIFTKGMSVPKLTRSGGYLLLDALYARDHTDNDNTTITGPGGVKVIDDPSGWTFGAANLTAKTDIMEFYSHVRRKGITVNDSLFFYFGVGIYETGGAKTATTELFVNDVKFDTITNTLTNLGSQGGRTAWNFDGSGNVKNIGDMIIAMTYTPGGGGTFTLEPQIWLRKGTYDSFTSTSPVRNPFNFNLGAFDAQSGGINGYGYAHVEPKGGPSTRVAEGTSNSISNCLASPWGSSIDPGYSWTSNYGVDQFVELAINLTALGVDPSLFTNIDPCTIPYRSIIFYSHASPSPTSAPKDFAGPYPFWRYPTVISKIVGTDTLNCTKPTGVITADSAYPLAWYKWTGINGGNITGYNSDSTEITFNSAGKYVLESAPIRGCYTTKDTVTILGDFLYPVATANAFDTLMDGTVWQVHLYGGDSAASIAATNSILLGPSTGILWNWTGKFGFSSNLRNPLTGDSGMYKLVVTESRNGCKDSAYANVLQLPIHLLNYNCQKSNEGITLSWKTAMEQNLKEFNIFKSTDGKVYSLIAKIEANGNTNSISDYSFTDKNPFPTTNIYKLTSENIYGTTETVNYCSQGGFSSTFNSSSIEIAPNPVVNQMNIHCKLLQEDMLTGSIKDVTGKVLIQFNIQASDGLNTYVIKTENLPSGVYFLQLNGKEFNAVNRFIKL